MNGMDYLTESIEANTARLADFRNDIARLTLKLDEYREKAVEAERMLEELEYAREMLKQRPAPERVGW